MTVVKNTIHKTVLHYSANAVVIVSGGNAEVLSANLAGTVSANDTVTQIDGIGTAFDTDFSTGDLIAVHANSTYYEFRTIATITDANTMDIAAAPLFTSAIDDSGLDYAYVTPASGLTSNTSENVHNAGIAQVWHGADAGAWILERGNSTVNSIVGVYDSTGYIQYIQHGEMLNLSSDGESLWLTLVGAANGHIMIDLRKDSSF